MRRPKGSRVRVQAHRPVGYRRPLIDHQSTTQQRLLPRVPLQQLQQFLPQLTLAQRPVSWPPLSQPSLGQPSQGQRCLARPSLSEQALVWQQLVPSPPTQLPPLPQRLGFQRRQGWAGLPFCQGAKRRIRSLGSALEQSCEPPLARVLAPPLVLAATADLAATHRTHRRAEILLRRSRPAD